MSWSRSYSGKPHEVIKAAKADQASIEASLPEFERADVAHVIAGAEAALQALPHFAQVSLSINGHGYRNEDGSGGGGMGVSINHTVEAAAPAAPYPMK